MYLVRSWPRLSQTFVVDELLAQERLGTDVRLYSLARSGEHIVQPQVAAVRAQVHHLDERRAPLAAVRDHARAASSAPLAYLRTLVLAASRPGLARGYANLSTLGCFAAAVRMAADVHRARRAGAPVEHLHAHFAHDPALVALLVGRLTGVPHSFTAHARDLYQIPVPALRARAGAAGAVVTCCAANADYLRRVLPARLHPRLRLVHHGVALERFAPAPRPEAGRPVEILAVGRLVEKKGFPDLLQACRLLRDAGHDGFRLRIHGDGPLRAELVGLRDRLGLQDRVDFLGEADGDRILRAYQRADVFALTPCVTADGDRDGVPNVIVEAMACGLPVVTTDAGGIAEVVRHGTTGLVAAPRDVGTLARHLAELVGDPLRRRTLGEAGRRVVEQGFDVRSAASELSLVFAGTARP
jgi:glycosyltransferase involved in cell wall biosynthesis